MTSHPLTQFNFKWLGQNFSLQYQYNIISSDENKEKY